MRPPFFMPPEQLTQDSPPHMMSSTQKNPTPLSSFKTPVHQIYSGSTTNSNVLSKRLAAAVAVGGSPALTPRTPRTPRSLAPPSSSALMAGEQHVGEEEEARLNYRRLQMNGMATPGYHTPRGSSHKDRSESRCVWVRTLTPLYRERRKGESGL